MDLATALRMDQETSAEAASGPFPGLTDEQRERLTSLGINPEGSLEGLLAEVRIKPPERLLGDLGITPGFL